MFSLSYSLFQAEMVPWSQDSHRLGHQSWAMPVFRFGNNSKHRGGYQCWSGHTEEWSAERQVSVITITRDNWISFLFSLLKPDFLLIRQDPRDAGEDFKSALLGFQYGQVPSINSLESVYNFQVDNNNAKLKCWYILKV